LQWKDEKAKAEIGEKEAALRNGLAELLATAGCPRHIAGKIDSDSSCLQSASLILTLS
jgi:hypothetical protein